MAFEADCGVSTVLEEIRVTSTVRSPVPGKYWATAMGGFDPASLWCGRLARTGRTVVNVRPRRPHHKDHQDV